MNGKPTYQQLKKENESLRQQFTERMLTKEALQENELKFRLLANYTYDWEYWIDPHGNYIYLSPSCQRITGYTPEEFISNPGLLNKIVKSDYKKKVDQHYHNESNKDVLTFSMEFPIIDKNGNERWLEHHCSPVFDENGEYAGRRGNNRDITESRITAIALKESEEKYRLLAENNSDVIWVYNITKEKFTYASPSAYQLHGYTAEEAIKRSLSESLTPDSAQQMQKVLPSRIEEFQKGISKTYTDELQQVRKDGKIDWVEIVTKAQYANDGTIEFLGVSRNISERKKNEEALLESQRRITTLMENLPGMAYRCLNDSSWTMEFVSKGCLALTGYKAEDIINNSLISYDEIIEKADRKMVWDKIQDAINNNQPFQIVYRIVTSGGEQKWIWEQGQAIYNSKNEVLALEGFAIDITESKKAEEKIAIANRETKESEKKFRELFEKSGDALLILENGIFTDCNQATVDMLNYSTKDEILNLHPSKLSPSIQHDGRSSIEKADEMMTIALKNGTHRFEWSHTKKNNEIFPAEILLTTISNEPDNEIIHVVCRDITNRKEADQKIKASRDYLEELTNSMWDAVFSVKMPKRVIEWANDSFNLLGYSPSEYIGNDTSFLYASKAEFQALGEKIEIAMAAYKQVLHANQLLKRKNGEIFPAEITITFHRENNKVIRTTSIISDITERIQTGEKLKDLNKQLATQVEEYQVLNEELTDSMVLVQNINKELEKAKTRAEESDRLKSAFLANMSHEIRTPMNGILGFADLLKTPNLTSEQLNKYTGIIKNSGKRMLNIINDLIDISKIEAGQMDVDISECEVYRQIDYLHTFFKPEADKKGLVFSYNKDVDSKDLIIDTDREKLYAIFTNLIKNSIKYTVTGSIEFGYLVKGSFIEFYVIDTGIGIPANRQKAIFERFVQADIEDAQALEGAGLGLAITTAYVEMLGGKIWVESKEGVGSKFSFTIPNVHNTETISEPEVDEVITKPQSKLKKLKILIVEDEDTAHEYFTIILKNICSELLHTDTGTKTIEICKANPDIDLILMDIRMPDTDGYEATKQIRKFNKKIKIIAQTAYALEGDRQKVIDAGCDDYISKPIDRNKLINMITKLISG